MKYKSRKIVHTYLFWIVRCSWCGKDHPIATDGRNLFCSGCGY